MQKIQKKTVPPRHSLFVQSQHRIEAFFDAVYAIVMTILVLGLTLPSGQDPGSLFGIISLIWPQFFHFALSFYILAAFWRYHHWVFASLSHLDDTLINLTFCILFVTCLLPFTTSIAGDFSSSSPSVALFHLNMLFLGGLFSFQWIHINRAGLFHTDYADFRIGLWRGLVVPVCAGIGLFLSLFVPELSSVTYIFIPIFQFMITWWFSRNQQDKIPEGIGIESDNDSAHSGWSGATVSENITIIPDAHLLSAIDESAGLMGVGRETLVLKILQLWEKKNQLPLQGKNNLCSIIPDNSIDFMEDGAPSNKTSGNK